MKKLVLIAEDEEALREVFVAALEDMGHDVIGTDNGEDALSVARAHRPDVIVSDYMMPRSTGLDLLRAIRSDEQLGATPFVLISAAHPKGLEEADTYLAKPIDLATFERTVEDALRRAPVVSRPAEVAVGAGAKAKAPGGMGQDELFGWVAHEIKTPLAAAQMNTQLLERQLRSTGEPDQVRRCGVVLHQLHRINDLVSSVLDAARLAEGKVELRRVRLELSSLVDGILCNWREMQPGFEFVLVTPPEQAMVELDPERVRQVLDNFISNAVKYGGTSRRVEVVAALTPGHVEFHVRDFGIGIDAAELPHVFARFRRVGSATVEGHGLGLFIAAQLARLHAGSVRVKSEVGVGTTFTLVLPRLARDPT